jgi:hypothetical protein
VQSLASTTQRALRPEALLTNCATIVGMTKASLQTTLQVRHTGQEGRNGISNMGNPWQWPAVPFLRHLTNRRHWGHEMDCAGGSSCQQQQLPH